MLKLVGEQATFCDGVSRRSFLQAGFLGVAGLGLADVLKLQAAAAANGQAKRKTSVIFVELAGGPTQFETYDPKPNAPAEYRGPMQAVKTNVLANFAKEHAKQLTRHANPISQCELCKEKIEELAENVAIQFYS